MRCLRRRCVSPASFEGHSIANRGHRRIPQVSEDAPARALDATVNVRVNELGRISVWKSKFYGAFALNHRVVLHAIDATPARWRGDAGSSPLDGASTAASSPRNDLRCTRPALISTQANIPAPDADGRRRRRDRHCQRRRVFGGVAGALRVGSRAHISTCVLVLIVREAEDAEVLLGLAEHVERAAEPLGDGARLGAFLVCRAPPLLRGFFVPTK